MTYYNPNIQQYFNTEVHSDYILCQYHKFMNYSTSVSISIDANFLVNVDLNTCINSNYILVQNPLQLHLVNQLDASMRLLFYDLILQAYKHHLSSFNDYYQHTMNDSLSFDNDTKLYLTHRLYEFIELLIFGHLANLSKHAFIFNNYQHVATDASSNNIPLYTTLNDRLKLTSYCFQYMKFRVSNVSVSPVFRNISFDFSFHLC